MPPALNEFEISLFGPGVGECVVVHLGFGDWIVVDSCVAPGEKTPIAVQYLNSIGLDPNESVRSVIATHWDDDHSKGLCNLLKECEKAKFWCSATFNREDFFEFISHYQRIGDKYCGTHEFGKILELLSRRRRKGLRKLSIGPEYASSNKRIFSGRNGAEVYALSPSSGECTLGWCEVSDIPQVGSNRRRAVAQKRNNVSVVLWIKCGDVVALLGGDLENGIQPNLGWNAIVTSEERPRDKAHIIKVPHHGSSNAHNEDVWKEMLTPNPYGILTPMTSLSKPLPRPSDICRLLKLTEHLYITCLPQPNKPPPRDNMVQRQTRVMVRKRKAVTGQMEHVRLRCSLESPNKMSVQLSRRAIGPTELMHYAKS